MRSLAFFLAILTLATGCVLEDKPVIPEDGGVEAGPCGVCEFATPVCNDDLQCVECTAEQDSFCTDQMLVCKTGAFECVECNASSDCNEPSASRCDPEQNECGGCESEADCIGIEGRPVCDDRTCVQCTPATEDVDCGGNSCDPAAFTCTDTEVGSLETCEECVADSECGEDGNRCVPMFYPAGEPFPDGDIGFCLKTTEGGCERPYSVTLSARESLSGSPPDNYCGVVEDRVTCPAVRALLNDQRCPNGTDEECPPSGICREVGNLQNRCTYVCGLDAQCPADPPADDCNGSGDDLYCGG